MEAKNNVIKINNWHNICKTITFVHGNWWKIVGHTSKNLFHILIKTQTQWKDHYKWLLQEIRNNSIKRGQNPLLNHIQLEINIKDLKEVLLKAKNNKAIGSGGIIPDLLKYREWKNVSNRTNSTHLIKWNNISKLEYLNYPLKR